MLVKTLLKHCSTGFDLVIISDSVSGHTSEYSSVKDAIIEAGDGNRVISWEVGACRELGHRRQRMQFVLFITI